MATPAPASGGELSITVEPAAAHADDDAAAAAGTGEVQQSESRSADVLRRKLNALNKLVFCVAFLEWVGNAVGTLAFIWATVVLLGAFCSLLIPLDFWFATAVVFMEGSSWVFIHTDAAANQRLIFGSTHAFKWEDFSLPRMLVGQTTSGKLSVVFIGVGVALVPEFRPETASSILKAAFLIIVSLLLTRLHYRGSFVHAVLLLLGIACVSGALYCFVKTAPQRSKTTSKHETLAFLKATGLALAWLFGTMLLTVQACRIMSSLPSMRNPTPQLRFKISVASALAFLPFLRATIPSDYRYLSISVSVALLMVSNEVFLGAEADDESSSSSGTPERNHDSPPETKTSEQDCSSSCSCAIFLQIVETILPILFFWSVMFPLPGIPASLEISFYILLSVTAGLLTANLQIAVALLQVLHSILRLGSLLGHHRHGSDYSHLPDGANPNMVPSIVLFFMMELCQGTSYILAVILGLISFLRSRSLARELGFRQEWGAKAISLYFHQAYQTRMETGLFRQDEKEKQHRPSLDLESFAIQSLGCTSSHELQIVGLRILDNSLRREDSESNKKLTTEIVKDAKNIIANIIGLISCYLTVEENSGGSRGRGLQHHKKPIEQMEQHYQKWTEQMEVARLCLEFVRTIASSGGKISARFRKELSENPIFLDSHDRILNLNIWGWRADHLREQVMGIIAALALDEAARKEIGSNQSIIPNLMHEFKLEPFLEKFELGPSMYDDRSSSLRMAAGEALANLTIDSADNCCAILLADPELNLLTKLIDMLDDEYYMGIAANLLHNLCANSRDMLIDLGANVNLESALSKAMEMIRTKEGRQLEATLCVASQIGYVIPEYAAQELDPETDAAAAEQLVTKLLDTLKSSREPCLEYPMIRRVLVEVVISIVVLCPGYIEIFREKGAKDALDMVRATPSRLEKYRVFLGGEGVVPESLAMRDLVDNAKRLIYEATPTPGSRI